MNVWGENKEYMGGRGALEGKKLQKWVEFFFFFFLYFSSFIAIFLSVTHLRMKCAIKVVETYKRNGPVAKHFRRDLAL